MRARSVLFTLFGDVVRPAGGEAWLATITAAMGLLDIQPPTVRTALHRMTGEGWVAPRREGRYSAYTLTPRGVARLEEAAERIYRLRSLPWDGRWRLLAAPALPAATRPELEWVGYGELQPGLWVSPHDHAGALDGMDLGEGTLRFDRAASRADAAIADRVWDLAGLADQHRRFLADWEPLASAPPSDPAAAMALRLQLVHRWRKFLFTDPGLPDDVLPDDWPGHRAAELFAHVYEALREPSWRWYHDAQDRLGAGSAPDVPDESPFAAGLAALARPDA